MRRESVKVTTKWTPAITNWSVAYLQNYVYIHSLFRDSRYPT